MKENVIKYKGCVIVPSPSEKYPSTVQIIKTSKRLNDLIGRKFINLNKVQVNIDAFLAERVIEESKIKSYQDLQQLGSGPLMNED